SHPTLSGAAPARTMDPCCCPPGATSRGLGCTAACVSAVLRTEHFGALIASSAPVRAAAPLPVPWPLKRYTWTGRGLALSKRISTPRYSIGTAGVKLTTKVQACEGAIVVPQVPVACTLG